MVEMPRPKHEIGSNGPICPFCEAVFTPDEAFFYDEGGFDLECDCGGHFNVRPASSWLWSTQAKTFEDG